MVSRWENIKKCPNFIEIEINILKKVMRMSMPHLPGDLVAVEIAEIPEPYRFKTKYYVYMTERESNKSNNIDNVDKHTPSIMHVHTNLLLQPLTFFFFFFFSFLFFFFFLGGDLPMKNGSTTPFGTLFIVV